MQRVLPQYSNLSQKYKPPTPIQGNMECENIYALNSNLIRQPQLNNEHKSLNQTISTNHYLESPRLASTHDLQTSPSFNTKAHHYEDEDM